MAVDEERLDDELGQALRPVAGRPEARARIRERWERAANEDDPAAHPGSRRWLPVMAAAAAVLLAVSVATWGDDLWGGLDELARGAAVTQTDLADADQPAVELAPEDRTDEAGLLPGPDSGPLGSPLALHHDSAGSLPGHGLEIQLLVSPADAARPQFALDLVRQRLPEPLPGMRQGTLPEPSMAEALAQAQRQFGGGEALAALSAPQPGGYAVAVPSGTYYLLQDRSQVFRAEGRAGVLGVTRFSGAPPAWELAARGDELAVYTAREWLVKRGILRSQLAEPTRVRRFNGVTTVRFQLASEASELPVVSAAPAAYVTVDAHGAVWGARWLWPRWTGVHIPRWLTQAEVIQLAAEGRGFLSRPETPPELAAPLAFKVEAGQLAFAWQLNEDGSPVLVPIYVLAGQLSGAGPGLEPAEAELWLPAVAP